MSSQAVGIRVPASVRASALAEIRKGPRKPLLEAIERMIGEGAAPSLPNSSQGGCERLSFTTCREFQTGAPAQVVNTSRRGSSSPETSTLSHRPGGMTARKNAAADLD